MIIQQLTLHIEDRSGATYRVFQTLADKGINILSYSINDEPEYGVLRLIVDNVNRAAETLKTLDLFVELTPVYSLNVPNEPGSMSRVLKELKEHDISFDFLYAFQYRGISQAILHSKNMQGLIDCMTEYEKARLQD